MASSEIMKQAWDNAEVVKRYQRAEDVTGPFAKNLVEKAGISSFEGTANIFDLATGTGVVVAKIYESLPVEKWGEVKVLGGDISEEMLKHLKDRRGKNGWNGLDTRVVDGTVRTPLFLTDFEFCYWIGT